LKVKVKICGITNREDAETAVRFGADAIGLVFYEKSPRRVSPEEAKEIIAVLPPFITRVGVFVNPSEHFVRDMIEFLGLDRVQLHGDESPAFCRMFGSRTIKAARIKDPESVRCLEKFPVKTFLLDTYTEDRFGGTGKIFDWSLAVKAKKYGNIILSGGLNPENISEAIRIVEPYGVDVSSGVEERPGKKDPLKIKRFMKTIKERIKCKDR
jgi:phosphoribosylanthranilate isomerase